MRIQRLDLLAFGAFTDFSLDLSAGKEGFHLVYGPNETGKSTALRAIDGMLFGIDERSPDDFVHRYQNLRIGAVLRDADGRELAMVRRKGRKHTLRDGEDGRPVDEDRLQRILGGMEQETFAAMFGLDHGSLVEGGRAIVQGQGRIGEALFAASAGIAGLRTVREALAEEALSYFRPQGSKPAINAAAKAYEELQRAIREHSLPPSEWKQHAGALDEAKERKTRLDREWSEATAERTRLDRIRRALPSVTEREEIRKRLEQVAHAPRLDEDFGQKWRLAQQKLEQARQSAQETRAIIAKLEEECASLSPDEDLLMQEETIERLRSRLTLNRSALEERAEQVEPALRQFEREAAKALRELRPTWPVDDGFGEAESLRIAEPHRQRVQELESLRKDREHEHEAAARQRDSVTAEIEQTGHLLEELAGKTAVEGLRETVRRARESGGLEKQLAALAEEIEQARSEAKVALAQLPLFTGSLDQLEKLAVPGPDTIERFERSMDEARNTLVALEETAEKLEARRNETRQRAQSLEADLDVAGEDDLTDARRHRNQGWKLVRRAWTSGKAPDAEPGLEEAAFVEKTASGGDLAEAFEQAMHRADDVADRLREEADRVAELAQARVQIDQLDEEIAQAKAACDEAGAELAGLEEQWRALWAPLGIEPYPPREMRGWRDKQQALVAKNAELRGLAAEQSAKEAAIAQHRAAVMEKAVLAAQRLGRQAPDKGEPLTALLDTAESLADELQQAAKQREELEARHRRLQSEQTEAQRQAGLTEAALLEWRQRWRDAMEPLGLDEHASFQQANGVIEKTGALFANIDGARERRQRLEAIEQENQAFAQQVREVAQRVAPDWADVPPEETVARLYSALKDARSNRDRLEEMEKQLEAAKADLAKHERNAREQAGILDTFRRQAGADEVNALPQAEEMARERRECESRLRELDWHIMDLSGGTSLGDFIEQVHAEDADTLDARIEGLDTALARIDAARTEVNQTIGREEAALRQMDTRSEAARLSEEAESLRAAAVNDVERYASLRIAAAALGRAMERYREKNEAPMLRRAGEYFAQLTRGSFEGLRSDYDDRTAESVLVGVRAAAKTAVPVEGMSEGTADQLYLALRLAAVEQYIETHNAMPLIADDVLVNFDNERADAALRALGEVSVKTQVIFFTHHAHLVELAREVLPTDRLFVHELPALPLQAAAT